MRKSPMAAPDWIRSGADVRGAVAEGLESTEECTRGSKVFEEERTGEEDGFGARKGGVDGGIGFGVWEEAVYSFDDGR